MTRILRAIRNIKQYSTLADKKTTETNKLVYRSPNAGLIKLVKKFSLTTLGVRSLE